MLKNNFHIFFLIKFAINPPRLNYKLWVDYEKTTQV